MPTPTSLKLQLEEVRKVLFDCSECMNEATSCLCLTALKCMSLLYSLCLGYSSAVTIVDSIWAQNLSLDFLAIESDVIGIQMSSGYK